MNPGLGVSVLGAVAAASGDQRRADCSRTWLFGPRIDLLFLCGGWLWLLCALVPFANMALVAQRSAQPHSLLLLLGTLFVVDTHFGAPIAQARRSKYLFARMLSHPLWLLLVLATAGVLTIMPICILIPLSAYYFFAVSLHYCFQNLGVMRMYMERAGYPADPFALTALYALFALLALSVPRDAEDRVASMVIFPGVTFEPIALPGPLADLMPTVALMLSAVLALYVFFVFRRRNKLPPAPAVCLFLSMLFVYCLVQTSSPLWLLVPAFFHGFQALAVQSYVHKVRDGRHGDIATFLCKSFILGLTIGCVLPAIADFVGLNSQQAFAACIIAFSLHHFLLEAFAAKESRALP